ncbi:hypothetical protein ACLOJK_009096 [Asimina triloba]
MEFIFGSLSLKNLLLSPINVYRALYYTFNSTRFVVVFKYWALHTGRQYNHGKEESTVAQIQCAFWGLLVLLQRKMNGSGTQLIYSSAKHV